MKTPLFKRFFLLGLISLWGMIPMSYALSSVPLELAFGKREGTFVLKQAYRSTTGGRFAGTAVTVAHNSNRAKIAYSPCSTFKMPNSLIALNVGLVKDIDETIFKWSPEKCTEDEANQMGMKEKWCKDQSLQEAYSSSTVWAYKDLAHSYGSQVMQAYLTRFQYGNMSMEKSLTSFWLMEGLRISANDQIKFLEMFHTRRLGLKQATYDLGEKLFTLKETDEYRLCGKTGLGRLPSGKYLGWYVGYVVMKKPDSSGNSMVYYFAMNMEGQEMKKVIQDRYDIVNRVLAANGIN